MEIRHYEKLTDQLLLEQIWELLRRYNHAFIPPLSARENTYQSNLTDQQSISNAEPVQYFETLKQQSFIVALDNNNQLLGFMSFRMNYICGDLEDNIDTIYISTIIVDEAFRSKGVTTRFYAKMEEIARQEQRPITTRTWSTNNSHIHLLKKIGFTEALVIKNDRGINIDTVYFRKFV